MAGATTGWALSWAVCPICSSAACASSSLVTPGSSTRMRFSPWRDQGRLGDAEGVDAAAQHLDGLVDVGRGGLGRLGVIGLEHELRAAAQVEAEVGLDAQRDGEHTRQEAEDEEEANEGTA